MINKSVYAYCFEAKSIQQYIFSTGKLRYSIGASEIIDRLCGEVLNTVLYNLGLDKKMFSRCAGGSITALHENKKTLMEFRCHWLLIVHQYAPGLNSADGLAVGETPQEAIKEAKEKVQKNLNKQTVNFPTGNPLVVRSPITGKSAVGFEYKKSPIRKPELLDKAAQCHAYATQDLKISSIGKKFLRDEKNQYHWPVNMDKTGEENNKIDKRAFPFKGESRMVAILHADGNGLGQMLMAILSKLENNHLSLESYCEFFKALSEAIENSTSHAANKACQKHLVKEAMNNVLPARPIILAGDDITIILRSDLAIDFTETFLTEFEYYSEKELNSLNEKFRHLNIHIPVKRLTACAGLVFMRSNQPFIQGYELAESLCHYAKSTARKFQSQTEGVPSCLAFHRITSSYIYGDYNKIVQQELIHWQGVDSYRVSMQPYAIKRNEKIPSLSKLRELKEFLEKNQQCEFTSFGKLRELVAYCLRDIEEAKPLYRRLNEIADGNVWNKFKDKLEALITPQKDLPFAVKPKEDSSDKKGIEFISPLGDVLSWHAMEVKHRE